MMNLLHSSSYFSISLPRFSPLRTRTPIFGSILRFSSVPNNCPSRNSPAARSDSGKSDTVQDSAAFFDENGVVEDMDGYLNYLSLEYESVWDTKPSWCQPWTITLTGLLVVTCSWLVLHSLIASSIVAALISVWWYIFLYSYPKAYSEMIAERRKKVTSGLEDTYGMTKDQ